MTNFEFVKGWKLLILQPWGWLYRGLTEQGQPTEEARTQMEFYYDKLKWAHPEAWWKVAELYAQGKEEKEDKKGNKLNQWPSVWELQTALGHRVTHLQTRLVASENWRKKLDCLFSALSDLSATGYAVNPMEIFMFGTRAKWPHREHCGTQATMSATPK